MASIREQAQGWSVGRWLGFYFAHGGTRDTTEWGAATVTYLAQEWAAIKGETYDADRHRKAVLEAAWEMDDRDRGLYVEPIDGVEFLVRARPGWDR